MALMRKAKPGAMEYQLESVSEVVRIHRFLVRIWAGMVADIHTGPMHVESPTLHCDLTFFCTNWIRFYSRVTDLPRNQNPPCCCHAGVSSPLLLPGRPQAG